MVERTNLKTKARATAMMSSLLAEGGGVFSFSAANTSQSVPSAKCCSYRRLQLYQHRRLEPHPVLIVKSHDCLAFQPSERNRVIIPCFCPEQLSLGKYWSPEPYTMQGCCQHLSSRDGCNTVLSFWQGWTGRGILSNASAIYMLSYFLPLSRETNW